MSKGDYTKDWELYIAGKAYNNKIEPNIYDTATANIEFFHGNQWRNVGGDENMPKPTINLIKRITTFLIASLTTSKTKIHFEPLLYSKNKDEEEMDISDFVNAQVSNLLEKFKMDFKIKDALFDGALTGDMCAHLYFDMSKKPYGGSGQFKDIKGEICLELIDGTNVYFGNANNRKTEDQPYIIIAGRDTAESLRAEAKRYKQNEQDINNIQQDNNYQEQVSDSGKIEVETDQYGKALYIIVYRKKKIRRPVLDAMGEPQVDEKGIPVTEEVETILASKSVENTYIYKDIDTGLSYYPVAWGNWEKQKNQYHGRALVTGILPNQIFINRMFAMVMYHLMMSAFPKAVYNADVIPNWDNSVGSAIAMRGADISTNIKNIAGYLEPGNMSNQIVQVIEMAMAYTKETLGISDVAMGNTKLDNTSAIIAIQKSSSIPLENPKANLYEWLEDIGQIILDMMSTYYGKRPILVEKDGEKTVREFDFNQLKDTWLSVRADVGESSYWSEIAALQTLDNLLASQHIDFIQYLERVPEELIPQKQQLISTIKQRMQQVPGISDPSALIAQLSPEEQQSFMSAPPEVQQQILAQLQAPQGGQMPPM
ncbi:hypothetical protein [Fictibacillus phosphorivorans]|uniref:portal protein n=1 Tax=Fictibacillus phosphorivorans TaxID=1221500 RepID=UPI0035E7098A